MSEHPIFPWLTEPRRAYFYRILLAVQPLAIVYAITTDTTAPLWVGLGSAILGNGVATINTNRTG